MGNKHEKGMCFNRQKQIASSEWCSYEATDNVSIKVQMVFMFVLILIGFVMFGYLLKIINYRKSYEYGKLFGNVFTYIFMLVIGWFLCSFLKAAINIIIYYFYMRQDFQNQSAVQSSVNRFSGEPIVIFASVFTFLDFMATYFVLFTVLFIPYQWISFGLNSVKMKEEELQIEDRLFIQKKGFRILKFVKMFMKYFFSLLPMFLFLQPFLLFFTEFGCKAHLILYNVIFVIVYSVLILVFYIYGYWLSKQLSKRGLIKMNKSDYTRIKCEYVLLTCATLIRIALNIIFRIENILGPSSSSTMNCSIIDPEHIKHTVIFLSLAHSLMHVLPISLVLYVYRPNIGERIRDESLLSSELNEKDCSFVKN